MSVKRARLCLHFLKYRNLCSHLTLQLIQSLAWPMLSKVIDKSVAIDGAFKYKRVFFDALRRRNSIRVELLNLLNLLESHHTMRWNDE